MGAFKYDAQPLLPPGRHYMTLADISAMCVLPFTLPNNRQNLFDRLCEFVDLFDIEQIRCEMLINGSFLTAKLNPSDLDVAVIFCPEVADAFTASQQLLIDAVNDTMVSLVQLIDAYAETLFPIGHPSYKMDGNEKLWSEQFGMEHSGRYVKGIAVLRLGETDVGLRICR